MKNEQHEDFYRLLDGKIDAISSSLSELKVSHGKIYIGKTIIQNKIEEINHLKHSLASGRNLLKVVKNYDRRKKLNQLTLQINAIASNAYINNSLFLNNKNTQIDKKVLSHGTKQLDEYQSAPVLVDERNIQVIAGAGTGKTSTILGKIKYLLLVKNIDPEDILVLTYTKASSEDMETRVIREIDVNLSVFTFHKLGLKIISEVENQKPSLTTVKLGSFVKESISILNSSDKKYSELLLEYLSTNQYLIKSPFEFTTEVEYREYLKMHPITTLRGEDVKSGEEVQIANFLFRNQIAYHYEKKYPVIIDNKEFSQYRPDFYLPEYDIWIEHFAIDRDNNVPPFFKGAHGKTAREIYLDGITWKRALHQERNTKLVETYSYESFEGNLLRNLKNKLVEHGVQFNEMSSEELTKRILSDSKVVEGLCELFATVITLAKSNGYDFETFSKLKLADNLKTLKNLITPIYQMYTKYLYDNNDIDFTDMLNNAITYLDNGAFISKFKYVIIDEFQDLTNSTYRLIKSLRNSCDFKLFCVGDDWQSIYRFAGSNMNYLTKFDEHFGITEQFFINRTYRFGQSIADVSSDFIIQNPSQIKKSIFSNKTSESFDIGFIEGYTDKNCVDFMARKLDELPKSCQIMMIGRYNGDCKLLELNPSFQIKYSQKTKSIEVMYNNRKDLRITFCTAHASKGLEADYVFILNNKSGNFGFPSMIQDNPMIEYFLDEKDVYTCGEERRLFYVSLTRTKNKVWLLVNTNKKSIFVEELEKAFHKEIKASKFICPLCGSKTLIRNGSNGTFIGCSNYPICKYTKSVSINQNKSSED